MGRRSPVENRFRERVKQERSRRGWSQAELAKLLQDKGLEHILASTVAKIEAGERNVRIEEASAVADLFELPVDALLGVGGQSDLGYVLRMVVDTAAQGREQVSGIAAALSRHLEGVSALTFEGRDTLSEDGQLALDYLHDAAAALSLVSGFDPPADVVVPRPADPLEETWSESYQVGRQFHRDMEMSTRAVLRERRGTSHEQPEGEQ